MGPDYAIVTTDLRNGSIAVKFKDSYSKFEIESRLNINERHAQAVGKFFLERKMNPGMVSVARLSEDSFVFVPSGTSGGQIVMMDKRTGKIDCVDFEEDDDSKEYDA